MICNRVYAIDFAVKLITMSFRNNMNPGAGDQFAQYPRGWIYPYILNDRGNVNHSPSASVTNAESLPESSPQFMENSSTPSSRSTSSRPTSSAESKKAQDRWSKEEEKWLVQLWAEKHDQLESRESRKTWAWIAEKISKALGTNKTADKCMREMKYFIERYKNAKDWNKNQTGGSLRKSVYYDEVDKILGCRDMVTFNHVAEAGMSGDSAIEVVTESSDNTGEINTSSRPSASETPADKRRASKRLIMRARMRDNNNLFGFVATNTNAAACHDESFYGINCENP